MVDMRLYVTINSLYHTDISFHRFMDDRYYLSSMTLTVVSSEQEARYFPFLENFTD